MISPALHATLALVVVLAGPPPDTAAVGARALNRAMMVQSTETFDSFAMRDTVEVKNASYRVITAPVPQVWDRWAIVTRWTSPAGALTSLDSVIVSTHPLRPLRHTVHAETDSAEITYDGAHVFGWVVPGRDRPRVTFDRRVPLSGFPDGFREKVISLLPLRPDYAAEIPAFDAWSGDSGTVRMIAVSVAGVDTVQSPAGWTTCWKVTVDRRAPSGIVQTVWIATNDRRLIRSEARNRDGKRLWWDVAR